MKHLPKAYNACFLSQNFGKLINFATLELRSSVREKENVDVNKLLRNSEGKKNKNQTTAKFPRTRNDSRAEGLTRKYLIEFYSQINA